LDARWGVREAMLARLDESDLKQEHVRFNDPATMRPFMERLAAACRSRGVEFRNSEEFRQLARSSST